MAAIDQVIEWARTELPNWQADAVRRILTQDYLTANDRSEILAMLKERHGLGDPNQPAPQSVPIDIGQISGMPQTKVALILKSISSVNNVNAIPNGSYIPIGHEGLTIIYGENGAGKSGYARLIKRACSARHSNEPIHANIYGSGPPSPASAVFKVAINDQADQEVVWTDGGSKQDLLTNIVFFDSKVARVIVDEENHISFLPFGAQAFPQLVNLLKDFHERLAKEKPVVAKLEYKDISSQTSSGRFIDAVSSNTSIQDVDAATIWADTDHQRLSQLNVIIAEAESPERNSKIRRLKNTILSIRGIKNEVERINKVLSKENEQLIKDALIKLINAEKAFALAAKLSVNAEPLAGVGGEVWQTLYRAAQEFSISQAYPGKQFPVLDKDGLCVLCMQPLLQEAKDRFQRFKEFMEQSTKRASEDAVKIFGGLIDEVAHLDFGKFDPASDIAQEMRERDPEGTKKVADYFAEMKACAVKTQEEAKLKAIAAFTCSTLNASDQLEKMIKAVEKELDEYEKIITPEKLQLTKAERLELEGRKLTNARKGEIVERIEILKRQKKYEAAMEATNLFAVSSKGKKIISESTTPALQTALRTELDKLGASYLPLGTISTRSEGEVFHKLTFTQGTLPKKVLLTDILSEGEQRVVAVAGFLAELVASNTTSPIVFDDPVSSLDHKFRDRIAARLADEAQNRQVVVFTHDISFLVELEEQVARIGGVKLSVQTIRRKGQVSGLSAVGTPWHAMKVGERINLINGKLSEITPLQTQDTEKYNEAAANLYGMLRETWEALIEEFLLNNVIRRHGSAIKTQSLRGVEVTTPNYRVIHFAMIRCSEWMTGHDRSKALDIDRPSPSEVRADIDILTSLRTAIKNRREVVQNERDTAIAPIASEIG